MVAALFISLFCVRANATPMFMGLGDLPGGLFSSHATGVSADGSVVVGGSTSGAGSQAFRWTQDGGMVGLGYIPGGHASAATGVSTDGSAVVGGSETGAFIWDSTSGMQELDQVLSAQGLDLTSWSLDEARAISGDGLTIVGNGTNPSGEREAWIAVLPGATAIEIDIKPTTDLNPINPMSRGVIPVATLGSETFDAADVDVSTLAFGPAKAMPLDVVCEDDLEDDDDDDRDECDRERGGRRHRHRGHPDDHGKWNDNDRKRHDRHHQFHGERHGDRRQWGGDDGNKHRDRRRHRGDRHEHRQRGPG
ncbi:MAG: hypothetical protein GY946_24035 [bacterium]|nr:hypothetical protein [bacterium]